MEINAIKTWQWMLIGPFLGLAISVMLYSIGPAFDGQSRDTIEQGEFENAVLGGTKYWQAVGQAGWDIRAYHKGLPLVRDLTVHPPLASDPTHRYWVTGRCYFVGRQPVDPTKIGGPEQEYSEWKPFKYGATAPYAPGYTVREEKKLDKSTSNFQKQRNTQLNQLKSALRGASEFPTVMDYLKAVSAVPSAQLSYKFAWWEKPAALWTLPPTAGLLMVGIALPLALRVVHKEPVVLVAAKPAAKATPKPAKRPMPKPAPVAVAATAPTAAPLEDKEYTGVYYPVVKTAQKEESKPAAGKTK